MINIINFKSIKLRTTASSVSSIALNKYIALCNYMNVPWNLVTGPSHGTDITFRTSRQQ